MELSFSFLFLLGALMVKGPCEVGCSGGIILISLLSLGKNLDFLYEFFFNNVPLFNKFRTPNSALSVVAFLVPILGFLALNKMFKGGETKEQQLKYLYLSAGVLALLCLFYAVAGGSMFDFVYAKDALYVQNYNINIEAVRQQRAEMMTSSAWRSLGLILAAGALVWLFIKNKISKTILIAGLGVLVLGDLWSVNKDYLNESHFTDEGQYKQLNAPRSVDQKILEDKDPNYRVFDISRGLSNAVNSSELSYYHKNLAGYHPAKLQRYQDMLDRHILPEAQQLIGALQQATSLSEIDSVMSDLGVINMLNTKYIVANDNTPIPNSNVLGNAWFVSDVQMAATPNEEIEKVRSIDPAETAIVHQDFAEYISGLNTQKNGTIQLTSYEPNHLTYSSSTSSEQLAVFSEVWYGPNKGWQAYIDGSPVDHIRVNYILRALRVPSGDHTIEFKFEPRSFAIGQTMSLISSLLIILGLLGFVGYHLYQKYQSPDEEKKVKKKVEQKARPTKSKKKRR